MDAGRDKPKNLSTLTNGASRRQMLVGVAGAFGYLTLNSADARAGAADEISSACEVIHQEVVFKVSRKRVYEALTDAKQFNKVVMLSAAVHSGMAPADKPVEISPEVGGAFSAFGGYITGRHVELVPNERIVQAWRAGGWGPGLYSIARFELVEQGPGTKLVFDHAGFPQGQAQHLAEGWKSNYWEPLEKYFAQS
ncbi:MAG TPA: SRPBCC family protein [Candidatus Acidoferrum sp.]|nr:SRPBCC family protein [Candidatus Acidoferrum sp.]